MTRDVADRVLCYATGEGGQWEAICVDFDLAVQGGSFEEVLATLQEAVRTYIQDARAESAENARRLLNRRAPWTVRWRLAFDYLAHILGRRDRTLRYGFDLARTA